MKNPQNPACPVKYIEDMERSEFNRGLKFFHKIRIHSIKLSVILRGIPWLTSFSGLAGFRIGVAKQAIVVAGLQTVRADVDRYFAAASGLYALAGVFFER